ncbi:MAG: hypothetical protein ACRDFB_04300 [Rhabdochlamydiaceae bacterium]
MGGILAAIAPIFTIITSLPGLIAKIEAAKDDPAIQALIKDVETEYTAIKAALTKL